MLIGQRCCNTMHVASTVVFLCILLIGCGSHKPIPVVDLGQSPHGAKQYYVAKGDTLYGIAFRFSLDVPTLASYNHLSKPYTIYPGQILNISQPTQPQSRQHVSKSSQSSKAKALVSKGKKSSVNSAKSHSKVPPKSQRISLSKKTTASPQSNDKGWLWPVQGTLIAKFSTSKTKKLNKGIDISAPIGTAVKSSRSGAIVYAGSRLKGYGKLIIVKHNDGYLSAYAHNQSILVNEGDWVKQGQKIATLGSSASSQPKLHFEIRKSGKPVDPLKYLAR